MSVAAHTRVTSFADAGDAHGGHKTRFLVRRQGRVIVSRDLDGIHLEASEHEKLGVAVAARVRELLAQ